jgi:predicted RNA-binding Zn ribbon-like protein
VEPIPLDGAGYPGTYKLIGGRVSLDFVNTVSWPDDPRRHDWFSSASNVEQWLTAAGLRLGRVTAAHLPAIRRLREVVTAVLHPLAFDRTPPAHAVQGLNRAVARAAARRRIDPQSLTWVWPDGASGLELFDPVVYDAADLVTERSGGRLRHCPACNWLFLDVSRNGARRWCDMADCGSRAKSRAYYRRTKPSRPRSR